MTAGLGDADRDALGELEPVLRRAVTLDPGSLVRLRLRDGASAALVRLPFGVLVSRTVESPPRTEDIDTTVGAADTLAWIDRERRDPPAPQDARWRTGLPPTAGWRRVETVPEAVLRGLVRSGALALEDAAARDGVPGAQPRAEVADALLDATVLTVTDDNEQSRDITLRALSALTRMGFLRRGGAAHIDVVGRWSRVVGEYGTVYLERPGSGLTLG